MGVNSSCAPVLESASKHLSDKAAIMSGGFVPCRLLQLSCHDLACVPTCRCKVMGGYTSMKVLQVQTTTHASHCVHTAEPDLAESTADGNGADSLPPASSEGLKPKDTSDVVAKALRHTIQHVDNVILQKEQKEADQTGSFGGSTAIVALRIAEVMLCTGMPTHCCGKSTLSKLQLSAS